MCSTSQYTTVIFDGDVLFTWAARTTTSISPSTLKRIISSPTWFDYERGLITQDICYQRLGQAFVIDPTEVEKAFEQARDSLQPNAEFISFIRELKIQSNVQLRIFAMSNISRPDYEVLLTKPTDWGIFDDVFASGIVGERKPNLGFYKHVLMKTGTDPLTAIFVDDKLENVLSARSLGLRGIVFENSSKVMRALRNLLGNPVHRGRDYLNQNAGQLHSLTDSCLTLTENFAQLLILEATRNRSVWNFTDFVFDLSQQ
jgi:FMN phosphatase YigB (HAD superfamily)